MCSNVWVVVISNVVRKLNGKIVGTWTDVEGVYKDHDIALMHYNICKNNITDIYQRVMISKVKVE